jgi:hypothetical protein
LITHTQYRSGRDEHGQASQGRLAALPPCCAECPVLAFSDALGKITGVKRMVFKAVKRQETRSRMRLAREAAHGPKAAATIQKRVSLVGDGAKWQITNFKQFARATSQWA